MLIEKYDLRQSFPVDSPAQRVIAHLKKQDEGRGRLAQPAQINSVKRNSRKSLSKKAKLRIQEKEFVEKTTPHPAALSPTEDKKSKPKLLSKKGSNLNRINKGSELVQGRMGKIRKTLTRSKTRAKELIETTSLSSVGEKKLKRKKLVRKHIPKKEKFSVEDEGLQINRIDEEESQKDGSHLSQRERDHKNKRTKREIKTIAEMEDEGFEAHVDDEANDDQEEANDDQEEANDDQEEANDDQEAANDDQEETNDDQEAANDDQEAANDDQEAANDDQEETNDDQEAANDDQEETNDDQEEADVEENVNDEEEKDSDDTGYDNNKEVSILVRYSKRRFGSKDG